MNAIVLISVMYVFVDNFVNKKKENRILELMITGLSRLGTCIEKYNNL